MQDAGATASGDWIALAAIGVALSALGLAVWEGIRSRRHYRLSVRPKLQLLRALSRSSDPLALKVQNVGLGPAVFVSFEYFVDGQCISNPDVRQGLQGIFNLLFDGATGRPEFEVFVAGEGLRSGEEIALISFPLKGNEERVEHFVRTVARRFSIRIRYKSFYGEKAVLEEGPHFEEGGSL